MFEVGLNHAWRASKNNNRSFERKTTRTKTPVLANFLEYQSQV
jgi:hypothetical protein